MVWSSVNKLESFTNKRLNLIKTGPLWPVLNAQSSFQTGRSIVELNVLAFLLPLAAIIFFNYHILASLRVQTEVSRTRHGGPTDGKTTVLILVLVATFLVCWTPYHLFAFLEFLFQVRAVQSCFWENFIDLGLQCANFFAFINSCLNPVIYVFVGQLFRTKVWELYKQCTPRSLTPMSSSRRKEILQLFWRN